MHTHTQPHSYAQRTHKFMHGARTHTACVHMRAHNTMHIHSQHRKTHARIRTHTQQQHTTRTHSEIETPHTSLTHMHSLGHGSNTDDPKRRSLHTHTHTALLPHPSTNAGHKMAPSRSASCTSRRCHPSCPGNATLQHSIAEPQQTVSTPVPPETTFTVTSAGSAAQNKQY